MKKADIHIKDLPIHTKVEVIFGYLVRIKRCLIDGFYLTKGLKVVEDGYLVWTNSIAYINPSRSDIKLILESNDNVIAGVLQDDGIFLFGMEYFSNKDDAVKFALNIDELTIFDVKNDCEIKALKR